MENKLLVEINQIRSNMGLSVITENTQIILEAPNSGTLIRIFNSLLGTSSRSVLKTLLTVEEKDLVRRYFANNIKDDLSKLKLSNFMKTANGATTIQELKAAVIAATNRRNNPISQADQIALNKIINKMEKTKTTWSKPLPKTDSIVGKAVKIKDILTSYFKYTTTIEKKIRDDVASYKYLRDKASKMTFGADQTLAIKEATRYLNRIELNLGILNRKGEEAIDAMISQLKQDAALLPKKSPERIGLEKVITKMESSDATIESIWKYLPNSYKPEGSVWDEIKRLQKERAERLQGAFGNKIPGVFVSKTEGFKKSIGGGAKNWGNLLTGGMIPMINKMFNNPKLIPRILLTETGSRLFGYLFTFAGIETLYDFVMWLFIEDKLIDDEFIKKYPRISKIIEATGPDYKEYFDNHATDPIANFMVNWFEKLGLTIPAYAINDWLEKNSSAGGGSKWLTEQRDKMIEIKNSDLTPEQKEVEIKKLLSESDSLIEDVFNFFGNESAQTLEGKINKELSGVNLSNTNAQTKKTTTKATTKTTVAPAKPNPVNTENQYTNDLPSFKKYMKSYLTNGYDESKVSGVKDTFTYDGETFTFNKGKFDE